jgi:hypothetical protein
MKFGRTALLGACVAAPLAMASSAFAQSSDGTRVIQVPPGAIVLILGAPDASLPSVPATAISSEPVPLARLIAEQQSMMQRMMADMDALFPPLPDPAQLVRAAMQNAERFGGGMQPSVTTTSLSGVHGVCGESVSYVFPGAGGQPQVHVTRYGDACGAPAAGSVQDVTAPPISTPKASAKVLEVGYRPHPVTHRVPPRT